MPKLLLDRASRCTAVFRTHPRRFRPRRPRGRPDPAPRVLPHFPASRADRVPLLASGSGPQRPSGPRALGSPQPRRSERERAGPRAGPVAPAPTGRAQSARTAQGAGPAGLRPQRARRSRAGRPGGRRRERRPNPPRLVATPGGRRKRR